MSAFSVGQLANRLATGYYAAAAAREVARRPGVGVLVPLTEPGHSVPIGRVKRQDGTEHAFDFSHFLSQASNDPEIDEALDRAWLVGALLTLGDALDAEGYFDRSPEFEMIYHLRNGVAHGNQFNITNHRRLQAHPANTFLAANKGDLGTVFEIDASLNGTPVLFGYMGPADVVDLLMSVSTYLLRVADGQPGHQP